MQLRGHHQRLQPRLHVAFWNDLANSLPWLPRGRSILKRIAAICSERMQTTLVDSANLFRLVHFFDILAAVVFAVSGSLVASRKGMDVMGFMWFAVITGVGGGTVRDLILNVPVFWVQNPAHVSACLVTAVVMHFVAPLVESRYKTHLWFDAFGLALVTVAGTVKASDVGAPALVAIAMGAVTGSVGGIIRDTLGHVPSVLLGHEIYITASVLGACTYVGFNGLGVGRLPAMVAGFLVTFGVRGLAIKFGWSLPVFRKSTKRERWKSDRKDSAERLATMTRAPAPYRGNDKLLFGIILGVLAFWLFAQTTLNIAPAMAADLGIRDQRHEHRRVDHGAVLGHLHRRRRRPGRPVRPREDRDVGLRPQHRRLAAGRRWRRRARWRCRC